MTRSATGLERIKRLAISLFLLFHILAITCWCVPLNSPLLTAMRNTVRPYMLWAGLFQAWDMFAPFPRTVNSYVEAVVIFKDGHNQQWSFPRMSQLSLGTRYRRERFRKYTDILQDDANKALWPDAARYAAYLHRNPKNPPEIVLLVRHWSDIIPGPDNAKRAEPLHTHIFYDYRVDPRDLQ